MGGEARTCGDAPRDASSVVTSASSRRRNASTSFTNAASVGVVGAAAAGGGGGVGTGAGAGAADGVTGAARGEGVRAAAVGNHHASSLAAAPSLSSLARASAVALICSRSASAYAARALSTASRSAAVPTAFAWPQTHSSPVPATSVTASSAPARSRSTSRRFERSSARSSDSHALVVGTRSIRPTPSLKKRARKTSRRRAKENAHTRRPTPALARAVFRRFPRPCLVTCAFSLRAAPRVAPPYCVADGDAAMPEDSARMSRRLRALNLIPPTSRQRNENMARGCWR